MASNEEEDRRRAEKARQVGLFRCALIQDLLDPALTSRERGCLARELAEREHTDPFGRQVKVSRGTIDRWTRDYRRRRVRRAGSRAARPTPSTSAGEHRDEDGVRAESNRRGSASCLPQSRWIRANWCWEWSVVRVNGAVRSRDRVSCGMDGVQMSAVLVKASCGQKEVRLGPISAEAYRAFLASSAGSALAPSFLQCPSWGAVKDGWQAHLLGWGPQSGPGDGELSGVALVLLRQFPGIRKYFAYLPEGPVANWADPDLDGWLNPLLRHLHAMGSFAVRIGPAPPYRQWDAAGLKAGTGPGRRVTDVVAREVDPLGAAVTERLRARGWLHCDDDGDAQPRYVFQVPLARRSSDDLWSGLNQEWRRNVRRAHKSGVEVTVGRAADLPEFYRLLQITEERDGFRLGRSLAYFERQYAALNAEESGRMRLYLARHQGEILAAHTMITVGRRVWYQTGASADHRREVRPSNALQWQMMLDAHARGAEVYDMRGIPSTLDPESRPFGLLRWKLGTGGHVVETLGEWETPLNGTANHTLYRAFQMYLAHR
jgi:lipid II:glycine glycyltransferase (peptidoglycan interpeptide bridge formation enzyme)